jgi:Uncharacterised protein family
MLDFLSPLFLLITIDQETLLNWFGIKNQNNSSSTSDISLETVKIITQSLWQKVQAGLTLTDIENIIFFLLCIRFLVLTFRYNLKTSFYITCISICAGFLWYRHLIDILAMYRQILLKINYFRNLGLNMKTLQLSGRALSKTDLKVSSDDVHWYNPTKLLYYAIKNGICRTDPETNLQYYIDPISMIISNLDESIKIKILPMYYKVYNNIIPRFLQTLSQFWNELSSLAAYSLITRVGKRYCPYLIRWHWTLLLIIGFLESILMHFIFRVMYFKLATLTGKVAINAAQNYVDPNLALQINIATYLVTFGVLLHVVFLFLGLFHAICGQYFYFPFLVENTELHIGPRPKNSIYSGGYTSWQDEKEANTQRRVPKLWYGWFGSGGNETWGVKPFKYFLIKNFKKLIKKFRK